MPITARQLFAEVDAVHAESNTVRDRLAASKRYRGRANDVRLLASLDELIAVQTKAALDAQQAECYDRERARLDALEVEWHAEDAAAFRERVATRAYYMALNGEGSSDVERWLWAEAAQRGADIQAARDALPTHHFGEWLSPTERRRRDRAVALH